MSTVPEVIAARQAGMEVMVLSLVTNPVVIPEGYRSAREVVEAEVSMEVFLLGQCPDNASSLRRWLGNRWPRWRWQRCHILTSCWSASREERA